MEHLDSIPVQLDPDKVVSRLHLGEKYLEAIREAIEIAHSLIKPRVVYEVSYVTRKNTDSVDIDDVRFTSRVLRVNLDRVNRVFPYIMTIGAELENKATSSKDLMKQFYLETMGDLALDHIGTYLEEHLTTKYRLGKISEMNPGSLEDWPITEQKPLFSIFGDVHDLIGVKLTESFLMIPRKSVSGIYFPKEVTFYSCQLCPRKNCKERQAPYDETLKAKYGI